MKRHDQEPLADWTRRVLADERAQWDPLTLRDVLRAWVAEYGQAAPGIANPPPCSFCGGDGWWRGPGDRFTITCGRCVGTGLEP